MRALHGLSRQRSSSSTHLSRDAHHRTATAGYCLSTLPKGVRTRLSIFVSVFRFREVILFAHCASLNLTTLSRQETGGMLVLIT